MSYAVIFVPCVVEIAVTMAPGTMAPLASVTTPLIFAPCRRAERPLERTPEQNGGGQCGEQASPERARTLNFRTRAASTDDFETC